MNQNDILSGIAEIIRDALDQPKLTITRETVADQVRGWDSFNHINIVIAVEDKFGVRFSAAEMEGMRDVGELVDVTARKLG